MVTAVYAVIVLAVTFVLMALLDVVAWWVLAAAAGVAVCVGTAAYERSYRAAAQRLTLTESGAGRS